VSQSFGYIPKSVHQRLYLDLRGSKKMSVEGKGLSKDREIGNLMVHLWA
jgi:hypothetical protein